MKLQVLLWLNCTCRPSKTFMCCQRRIACFAALHVLQCSYSPKPHWQRCGVGGKAFSTAPCHSNHTVTASRG